MNALLRQIAIVLVPLVFVACRRDTVPPAPRTAVVEMVNTPVRLSMEALHQSGGVPPNWQLTLPKGDPDAGREIFTLYGCHSCHVVQGEAFSAEPLEPGPVGPDLTGMGSHHPEGYFVESILNPDAIIVDDQAYVGDDNLSTMPAYPDLTAEHLTHLVAYLKSLTDAGEADPHAHHKGADTFTGRADVVAVPAEDPSTTGTPPPSRAKAVAFFVQTYSVREGKLADLERWFAAEGLPAFRSYADLLEVETHIDRTRGPESLVTVFSFAHIENLREFLDSRRVGEALTRFDEFTEVIDRQIYETKPLYRVGALSGP